MWKKGPSAADSLVPYSKLLLSHLLIMASSALSDAGPAICRRHHDATIHRGLFRGMTDGRFLRCPLGLCLPSRKHHLCKHCPTLPYVALPLHQVFILREIPRRWARSIPGAYPATGIGGAADPRLHPQLLRNAKIAAGGSRDHAPPVTPSNGVDPLNNDENDQSEACAPEIGPMPLQTKTGSWERFGNRVRKIVYWLAWL